MKTIKIAILFLMLAWGSESCVYDFIASNDLGTDDTTGTTDTLTVSFATQIQPIFNNNCISCHKSGGPSPNLTSGSAYSQINRSKYINITSPSQSLLYRRLAPGGGYSGHKKVTDAQAALVLSWIKQGAKNN